MSSESGIEPQDLADRLRGDPLISDVEVISGPEQGRMTAFIVGQGFRPGPELREKAMSLASELSGRLQVAILPKIRRQRRLEGLDLRTACQLSRAKYLGDCGYGVRVDGGSREG